MIKGVRSIIAYKPSPFLIKGEGTGIGAACPCLDAMVEYQDLQPEGFWEGKPIYK